MRASSSASIPGASPLIDIATAGSASALSTAVSGSGVHQHIRPDRPHKRPDTVGARQIHFGKVHAADLSQRRQRTQQLVSKPCPFDPTTSSFNLTLPTGSMRLRRSGASVGRSNSSASRKGTPARSLAERIGSPPSGHFTPMSGSSQAIDLPCSAARKSGAFWGTSGCSGGGKTQGGARGEPKSGAGGGGPISTGAHAEGV